MGRYSAYKVDELPPRVHELLRRYNGLLQYEVYCGDLICIRWGDLRGVITDYDLDKRSARLEVCFFGDVDSKSKVSLSSTSMSSIDPQVSLTPESSVSQSAVPEISSAKTHDNATASQAPKLQGDLGEFVIKMSITLPEVGSVIIEQLEVRFRLRESSNQTDSYRCYGVRSGMQFDIITAPLISFVTSDGESQQNLKISRIEKVPESWFSISQHGISRIDISDVDIHKLNITESDSFQSVISKVVQQGTTLLKYI